jgi:hypothetical protein
MATVPLRTAYVATTVVRPMFATLDREAPPLRVPVMMDHATVTLETGTGRVVAAQRGRDVMHKLSVYTVG